MRLSTGRRDDERERVGILRTVLSRDRRSTHGGDQIRGDRRVQLRGRYKGCGGEWLAPFHVTTVPAVNPVPLATSVNAGPPAVALLGEMLVRVNPDGVMVNGSAFDVSLNCLRDYCAKPYPQVAIKLAGTVAVNCEPEIRVVASAFPFQVMLVVALNPEPLMVMVNAGPPATALFGERLVSVNVAAVMVNGSGEGEA